MCTIWLNMSHLDVNMPEYVCISDNRQVSDYVSYNLQNEVTLQVNKSLLKEDLKRPVKDLRRSNLGK